MKYPTIIFSMCVLLLSVVFVPTTYAQEDAAILTRINGLRSSLGLVPYSRNGALDAAAATHARWMVDNGQVSHTGSGGSTPRTRAAAAGYSSQFVSENIYGGTNASVDVAWNFWINSSIHYRGLTSPNYQEVGIGIARGGWGAAYVLVFGSQNASWSAPAASTNNNGNGASGGNAAPPPSFIVGKDTYGNLMHEIQPGDTLGDIALLYGYTWDDLPYMMSINSMEESSIYDLEVGAVFLVPPKDGTYTPTPNEAMTATPTPTNTPHATVTSTPTATPTPDEGLIVPAAMTATAIPTVTPTATVFVVATSGAPSALLATLNATPIPTATATPQVIAAVPDNPPALTDDRPPSATPASRLNSRSTWFMIAVGLQVVMILGAGWELVRRNRR